MKGYKVVVDKSTVPVGTAEKVHAAIAANYRGEFDVVSKILNKKVENRKTLYLTKWKGFDEPTWESSEIFNRTKDLRELRKAFNS
jgi:hypothetical protein